MRDEDDRFALRPLATQRIQKVLSVGEHATLVCGLAGAASHHGVVSPYHDPCLRTLNWQEVSRPVDLGLVRRVDVGSGQRGSWLSNEFLGGGFLAAEEPGDTQPRRLMIRFRA